MCFYNTELQKLKIKKISEGTEITEMSINGWINYDTHTHTHTHTHTEEILFSLEKERKLAICHNMSVLEGYCTK